MEHMVSEEVVSTDTDVSVRDVLPQGVVPHRAVCVVCNDVRYLFDAPVGEGDTVRHRAVERDWTCIYCWPAPPASLNRYIVERHCKRCGRTRYLTTRERRGNEPLHLTELDHTKVPEWVRRQVASVVEVLNEREVCSVCRVPGETA